MAGREGRKSSKNRPTTNPAPPCTLKLLMIGNIHTGKSSLVRNYCSKDSETDYNTSEIETHSIGLLDCMDKTLDINGQEVTLEIWDTAGTETYDSITANYYRGADGVCLTYSIIDNKSFDLLNVWMSRVHENTRLHTPVMLLGTKSDLEEGREVEKHRAQSYANEQEDIRYFFEVSIKNKDTIDQAMFEFSKFLIRNHSHEDQTSQVKTNTNQGCCH
ncbi:Ras-related protein Rab-13 isoform X1 [Oopsacas minuta]|uniref:Ras-related protein Rab-13 isoform X1 n=1 Tax=Oopsacas minuta TaxID=111878 RepID=A0AAV7K636_9METZ|nr:Ras-related protein Rab-13 isoform X1 [Oopsacas minuta]